MMKLLSSLIVLVVFCGLVIAQPPGSTPRTLNLRRRKQP